jgi:hypothetical protein
MELPTLPASPELAHVVWASHILSYLNCYTETAPDRDEETNLEEEEEDEDSETATQDTDLLTPYDADIRSKFLNCVAELLSHSKGGAAVTATALREKEDSVEVDLARNSGFRAADKKYLASLSAFLAVSTASSE